MVESANIDPLLTTEERQQTLDPLAAAHKRIAELERKCDDCARLLEDQLQLGFLAMLTSAQNEAAAYTGECKTQVLAPGPHVCRVRALMDARNAPWLVVYVRGSLGQEVEVARIIGAFLPHRGLQPHGLTEKFIRAVESVIGSWHEDPH